MRPHMLWLGILVLLSSRPGLLESGEDKQDPLPKGKPAWYDTRSIGVHLVEQKKTIAVEASEALQIFDGSQDRLTKHWQSKLPGKLMPAKRVEHLPTDEVTTHVSERQPIQIQILGFDQNRVHVVLARHVGNHLWHGYHAVEADLMVERSDKVDALLNLKTFTAPFTRTVKGVGYGDSRDQVHKTLGPPDAERSTQTPALSWDYDFDENVTIEYKNRHVFKISKEVPKAIKDRTLESSLVRYRTSEPSSEDKSPQP